MGRGRRVSNRTKERIHKFRFRFRRKRLASYLPRISLDLGGDRRSMSGSRNVNLTIFITSMSSSQSLTSFTSHFFHLSGPLGLKQAFDAAERNGRFGRIQSQESKWSSSRGKRKRQVLLCKRTVRVEVRSKVIPTSFLKIEGRGKFVGAKCWRKKN